MLSYAKSWVAARSVPTLAFFVALTFACVLFGAIPWLSVPTTGQALWASGFAQSYANASGLAIHATDFGLPTPAAISFGLSATFVQGLLIRIFGIAAIDAYTLTVVLYLALALCGAAAMARSLGAQRLLALAIGVLWLALPIIWEHAAYSMLALGFALLPLYLYSSSRLFVARRHDIDALAAVGFVLTCTVAVFMDGYTFVMFFVASMILWATAFVTDAASRRRTVVFVLPVMVFGFFLAYFSYTTFIGNYHYQTDPLTTFRGWGVDVTMVLAPTRGIHWIWDVLRLSVARNDHMFWGDASIWMTTFLAPLIFSGLCGYVLARDRKRAIVFLVMALLGLYLSLGPSLKIDSTKQVPGISQADSGPLMPAQYALAPTGSGWLSEHIPGFQEMRAVYRWIGLGALGLWVLTALLLARMQERHRAFPYVVVALLITAFLPHLQRSLRAGVTYREKANAANTALGPDLRSAAGENGILFFAPHGNDFIVNYLAAENHFRSYNIGGDKNAEMAQSAWSVPMRNLNFSNLHYPGFRNDIRAVLLGESVDAVVLPYFDTLRAAFEWPPSNASIRALREERLPIAQATATSPCFQLREFPLFAAVSLTETGRREKARLIEGSTDSESIADDVNGVCRLTQ